MPISLVTGRSAADALYYKNQFARIINNGWSSLNTAEQAEWMAASLPGGYWYTDLNRVGAAILAESGLSFLGYGVPPPAPTWGAMLSGSGRAYMFHGPWLALAPGLCLTIVVFAISMFGDALRDLLDPRLRGSR